MLILIIGGSGSGKSAFAEQKLLASAAQHRYYLATMQVWDDEDRKRVERHQKLREGKGFELVECPSHLENLILPEKGSVLMEDLGNLLMNEFYTEQGMDEHADMRIMEGVQSLSAQTEDLILVSNEIFSDGIVYSEETNAYLEMLGRLHQMLAQKADLVVEVVCGIPLVLKG